MRVIAATDFIGGDGRIRTSKLDWNFVRMRETVAYGGPETHAGRWLVLWLVERPPDYTWVTRYQQFPNEEARSQLRHR